MKKPFNAVRWMRKRRTEIDEEDRAITWEEKRRKTHDIVSHNPILKEFCSRVLTPDQLKPLGVRETPATFEKDSTA